MDLDQAKLLVAFEDLRIKVCIIFYGSAICFGLILAKLYL